MEEMLSRTELLIGKNNMKKIEDQKIIVFGIGGVGSFVTEGLIRAGIKNITLVDGDKIIDSNLNRQIHATRNTIGKYKVDIMKKRILEINPDVNVKIINKYYNPKENQEEIEDCIIESTYIVDSIDMVLSKIGLIETAKKNNIKIISSMGFGNKLDPLKVRVSDIFKTKMCPLSRIIRKDLKKRGIKELKVVYSKEEQKNFVDENNRIGSISFLPSVAGLIIASEIIKDIINVDK